MSSLLQKLEDNKKGIILAEIGAYLHDLGKARKEFVEHYAQNGKDRWDGHNFSSIFPESLRNLLASIDVKICSKQVSLMDFIEKHHKERENNDNRADCEIPELIRLLYAGWNGYDGMDSGIDKGSANVKQSHNNIFISTAFGYEPEDKRMMGLEEETKKLYQALEEALKNYKTDNDIIKLRKNIIGGTEKYYRNFIGETRRSANDVTLWDHSYSVATLYKCAVAKVAIDYSEDLLDPLDFDWKLLSFNLDILSLLAKGIKIGDIKGYEDKVKEAFNKIKEFIEERYSIGNEVYCDTSGIYFLIPDIDIEELKIEIINELNKEEPELMAEIIVEEMKTDCDSPQQQIPPNIKDQRRGLERCKKEKLIKILPQARETSYKEISYPASSRKINLEQFKDNWEGRQVCPICRLRPMKENSDGCDHCLERRTKRAKEWMGNSVQSIWLDEVSDQNDRVALIIGTFVLENWLNGSFIKTMAISINPTTSKHPSPARIRRCWETTQEFIEATLLKDCLSRHPYGIASLFPELRNKRIQFTISPSLPDITEGSTIDIDIDGVRLSPVCIDKNKGTFITTNNLQILSNKGKKIDEIATWMNEKNIKIKKESESKWQGKYYISNAGPAEPEFQDYLPYIPIYEFPDQFMVLVPAYDALDIAKNIVEEYEVQFSKVRDRLPFHLGIIAFHRRTPLYLAMDAGKRLIDAFKANTKTISARVSSIAETQHSKLGNNVKKLRLIPDSCYSSVPLVWQISYSTGDPNQQDEWHPYIRVNGNPNRGNYSFDYDGNGNHVVHVKELRPNDSVKIETSYLKMSFLETASDRFKVDEKLLPLDDLNRLNEIWSNLQNIMNSKGIGISHIYAFWQEVKNRYEDYNGGSVWEEFVKSSLTNIFKLSPTKDVEIFNSLFQATKDGLLDLCLYWNLKVRKIKPEKQEVRT